MVLPTGPESLLSATLQNRRKLKSYTSALRKEVQMPEGGRLYRSLGVFELPRIRLCWWRKIYLSVLQISVETEISVPNRNSGRAYSATVTKRASILPFFPCFFIPLGQQARLSAKYIMMNVSFISSLQFCPCATNPSSFI